MIASVQPSGGAASNSSAAALGIALARAAARIAHHFYVRGTL